MSKHWKASLVILESPYRGVGKTAEVQASSRRKNLAYAKRAMHHSLSLGEAPFLSHLLYPLVLDDDNSEERSWGINAGLAWARACNYVAVYTDLGISEGMSLSISHHKEQGRTVVYRKILEKD